MDSERLKGLVGAGERDLVEFKREWWNLDSKLGKGELAKDVLAMANAVTPGESGYIIIGIEDKKAGGAVTGVLKAPTQETIAQILNIYTNPVPRIRLEEAPFSDNKLSVLEVIGTQFHPHYATRDVDRVLSTDVVYTRRAGTVGRLKPAEIEQLIRAKEVRLGKIREPSPLEVGYVELPMVTSGGDRVSVRVANVTEEPVINIDASVDVILVHYRNAVYRRGLIVNLTLEPGQTREFEFRPSSEALFYDEHGKSLNWKGSAWSRWIDLRLYLTYRRRDGILDEIIREASLS